MPSKTTYKPKKTRTTPLSADKLQQAGENWAKKADEIKAGLGQALKKTSADKWESGWCAFAATDAAGMAKCKAKLAGSGKQYETQTHAATITSFTPTASQYVEGVKKKAN